MTTRLHNYTEVRACLEKEYPDRLRALTPHINAPANYWAAEVLATSSAIRWPLSRPDVTERFGVDLAQSGTGGYSVQADWWKYPRTERDSPRRR